MSPEPVDPSKIPQLSGMFAPVIDEIANQEMQVVQGAVPADLNGAYLRNGPNSRFPPLGSYTYPLDGDGMVHAVRFADGKAHYTNRFVRTPSLEAEIAAGRALWGGVMSGYTPSADEVGPELAGREKDLPDINIISHGGRLLALAEGAPPFEMTPELDTVGEYDFAGALPDGMCAHPKFDPDTGEMIVFRYGFAEPYLTWSVVGTDGTVTQPETSLDLHRSHMIHDAVITERFLVLVVSPLIFDFEAMMRGGSLLSWQPDLGTRVMVIPRRDPGGQTMNFELEPLWVWHFANGHERPAPDGSGTEIVMDFPMWSNPGMGLTSEPDVGTIQRLHLGLDTGKARLEQVHDRLAEFPRIDDRLTGRPNRYYHQAAKDPDHDPGVMGQFNSLMRLDTRTGAITERRTATTMLGEAIFAPRLGSAGEDDGYIMTYAYDTENLTTSLLILDAADIAGEAVATLATPHRVPFGLHGNWLPAE